MQDMSKAWTYYWQRLAPFIGVYVLFELIELLILLLTGSKHPAEGDLLDSMVSFLNENTACLFFTALPYTIYLAVLPRDFHNTRWDKRLTLIFFSVFCLINWLEELVEVISRESFHLLTRDFIMNPGAAWQNVLQLPGVGWISALLLIVLVATLHVMRNKLMPKAPAPTYALRLAVPALLAGTAFQLTHQAFALDEVAEIPTMYDDGLFHIFRWIYELTAIPDMVQIFSIPCICLGWSVAGILLIYALIKQIFPEKSLQLPCLLNKKENIIPCLIGFLALILLVRLLSLGIYPLMDTTEARYGEMARKMVETGYWLQPQFEYGVPFWGKPPLSFWGSAATMLLCGVNELGARLAPYLATCGIGLCFLLWPFAPNRKEQATAAIIVLFISAMGFVSAGAVMTDAFLAFGTTLTMVSFYRAMTDATPRRIWGYLFFIGLVIGLLSKGPLALVVCGLPIFAWTLWQKKWVELWKKIPWICGTLMMLLLTIPWYVAAEQATPGFLRYFIIGEHFERFLVKGWKGDLYGAGHSRAIGTIWLYALEMFLPWVLLLPFIMRRKIQAFPKPETAFLWCWALSTPVFFTMARNILPAYILPAVPAFCILLVRRLWALRQAEGKDYRKFVFSALPLLLLICLFGVGKGFNHVQYRCQNKLLQNWDSTAPLYYVDNKVPYSAQFYSSGKAQILTKTTDELQKGDYLAVHRSKTDCITNPAAWEFIAQDGSWKLYRKR